MQTGKSLRFFFFFFVVLFYAYSIVNVCPLLGRRYLCRKSARCFECCWFVPVNILLAIFILISGTKIDNATETKRNRSRTKI